MPQVSTIKNKIPIISKGKLEQLKDPNNVGDKYFENRTYNYHDTGSLVEPFTIVFVNTKLGSVQLNISDNDIKPGDIVRFIDLKKTFNNYPLQVSTGQKPIHGDNTSKTFSVSGSIIDFFYIDDDIGWIVITDNHSRPPELNIRQFNIAPSPDNRQGLAVYQRSSPNTAGLASAATKATMPVVGIILRDNNTTVDVQTYIIDKVGARLDEDSVNPQPGQFVYLSDQQPGYLTNADPMSYVHRVGIIREVISDTRIVINYFPEAVYSRDECAMESLFAQHEFKQISGGADYDMFLTSNGQVWVSGRNQFGQLGLPDREDRRHPTRVDELCPIKFIAAGYYHSLSIHVDQSIWVMGRNDYGQLGTGDADHRYSPKRLNIVREGRRIRYTQVAAGEFHSLALDEDGNIWSWGDNRQGQLGIGAYPLAISEPVMLEPFTRAPIRKIDAGRCFSLALDYEGTVYTWGCQTAFSSGGSSPNMVPNPTPIEDIEVDDDGNVIMVPDESIPTSGVMVKAYDNQGQRVPYDEYFDSTTDSDILPTTYEALLTVEAEQPEEFVAKKNFHVDQPHITFNNPDAPVGNYEFIVWKNEITNEDASTNSDDLVYVESIGNESVKRKLTAKFDPDASQRQHYKAIYRSPNVCKVYFTSLLKDIADADQPDYGNVFDTIGTRLGCWEESEQECFIELREGESFDIEADRWVDHDGKRYIFKRWIGIGRHEVKPSSVNPYIDSDNSRLLHFHNDGSDDICGKYTAEYEHIIPTHRFLFESRLNDNTLPQDGGNVFDTVGVDPEGCWLDLIQNNCDVQLGHMQTFHVTADEFFAYDNILYEFDKWYLNDNGTEIEYTDNTELIIVNDGHLTNRSTFIATYTPTRNLETDEKECDDDCSLRFQTSQFLDSCAQNIRNADVITINGESAVCIPAYRMDSACTLDDTKGQQITAYAAGCVTFFCGCTNVVESYEFSHWRGNYITTSEAEDRIIEKRENEDPNNPPSNPIEIIPSPYISNDGHTLTFLKSEFDTTGLYFCKFITDNGYHVRQSRGNYSIEEFCDNYLNFVEDDKFNIHFYEHFESETLYLVIAVSGSGGSAQLTVANLPDNSEVIIDKAAERDPNQSTATQSDGFVIKDFVWSNNKDILVITNINTFDSIDINVAAQSGVDEWKIYSSNDKLTHTGNFELVEVTGDSPEIPEYDEPSVNEDTAVFELTMLASGLGTVVSNPGGINVSNDNDDSYIYNRGKITLEAYPESGYQFLGWIGDNTGYGNTLEIDLGNISQSDERYFFEYDSNIVIGRNKDAILDININDWIYPVYETESYARKVVDRDEHELTLTLENKFVGRTTESIRDVEKTGTYLNRIHGTDKYIEAVFAQKDTCIDDMRYVGSDDPKYWQHEDDSEIRVGIDGNDNNHQYKPLNRTITITRDCEQTHCGRYVAIMTYGCAGHHPPPTTPDPTDPRPRLPGPPPDPPSPPRSGSSTSTPGSRSGTRGGGGGFGGGGGGIGGGGIGRGGGFGGSGGGVGYTGSGGGSTSITSPTRNPSYSSGPPPRYDPPDPPDVPCRARFQSYGNSMRNYPDFNVFNQGDRRDGYWGHTYRRRIEEENYEIIARSEFFHESKRYVFQHWMDPSGNKVPKENETSSSPFVKQGSSGYYTVLRFEDDQFEHCGLWRAIYRTDVDDRPPTQPNPGDVEFVDIAAGGEHSLAIEGRIDPNTGEILEYLDTWSWGKNTYGQLGIGSRNTGIPQVVNLPSGVTLIKISAGLDHSVGIDKDGQGWAWGDNQYCQLGIDRPDLAYVTEPTQIVLPRGYDSLQMIDAGARHTLAVTGNGRVLRWGQSECGPHLGDDMDDISDPEPREDRMPQGVQFVLVREGLYNWAAIDTEGNIWTRGDNKYGQLGMGDFNDRDDYTMFDMPVGVEFVDVTVSTTHMLALDTDNNVWAWGRNDQRQVIDSDDDKITQPTRVTQFKLIPLEDTVIPETPDYDENDSITVDIGTFYRSNHDSRFWFDEDGVMYWIDESYLVESVEVFDPQVIPFVYRVDKDGYRHIIFKRINANDGFSYAWDYEGQVYTWGSAAPYFDHDDREPGRFDDERDDSDVDLFVVNVHPRKGHIQSYNETSTNERNQIDCGLDCIDTYNENSSAYLYCDPNHDAKVGIMTIDRTLQIYQLGNGEGLIHVDRNTDDFFEITVEVYEGSRIRDIFGDISTRREYFAMVYDGTDHLKRVYIDIENLRDEVELQIDARGGIVKDDENNIYVDDEIKTIEIGYGTTVNLSLDELKDDNSGLYHRGWTGDGFTNEDNTHTIVMNGDRSVVLDLDSVYRSVSLENYNPDIVVLDTTGTIEDGVLKADTGEDLEIRPVVADDRDDELQTIQYRNVLIQYTDVKCDLIIREIDNRVVIEPIIPENCRFRGWLGNYDAVDGYEVAIHITNRLMAIELHVEEL